MEQNITLKDFLREILEPIIDECLSRAMKKFISTMPAIALKDSGVLDMDEAAKYLKLSKPTLYGLTHTRQLPHYKNGKRIYIRKEDLDEWINKGRIKTMAEIEAEASNYIVRRGRRG